jgi:AP-3 complex subunit delta-1
MQRANERIQAAQGVPPEGTLVKKKAKKNKPLLGEDEPGKPRKKKVKKLAKTMDGTEVSTTVKKAKKKAQIEEGENMDGGGGDRS